MLANSAGYGGTWSASQVPLYGSPPPNSPGSHGAVSCSGNGLCGSHAAVPIARRSGLSFTTVFYSTNKTFLLPFQIPLIFPKCWECRDGDAVKSTSRRVILSQPRRPAVADLNWWRDLGAIRKLIMRDASATRDKQAASATIYCPRYEDYTTIHPNLQGPAKPSFDWFSKFLRSREGQGPLEGQLAFFPRVHGAL